MTTNINELIKKHCPNGVEYKRFGGICTYTRGITYNKSKETTATDETAWKVLRANNITLRANSLNFYDVKFIKGDVKVKPEQMLRSGDILICAGSGSKDHIGKVAYISEDIDYTFGGFMAVVRTDVAKLDSRFLFHFLTGTAFKKYLETALNTTTINNLSASVMEAFLIPVPPLPVQREIVRILDKFTKLEAELEAELEARRKQYEYYRNELLTFPECENRGEGQIRRGADLLRKHCPDGVKYVELGKIGDFVRGSGLQKKDFAETGVGCIHYGQIYTRYGTYATRTLSFVPPELAQKLRRIKYGDLVIACTSENLKDLCKAVVWLGRDEIVTGGHACVFSHNQNPKYIAYFFQTSLFYEQKRKFAKGTKVIEIKASELAKIQIPLPSLAEQERIVAILDRFETLVNDLSVGLPAELAARRRQYEYYRDRLLTFQPLEQKP